MEETPKRELLKSLIVKICEEQEKILRIIGPPKSSLQSHAANLEALKTPIYFVWEMLGYGDFPQSRVQHQWLASFKTSPPDFLSECIMQIKSGDILVDDINLRRTLIDSIQNFKNNSNDNILRYIYHIMKKRIRKKHHVGEFKQYGNVIILKTQGEEETAATILEKLEPIIEKFSLNVAGGGTGRLLIPPKKGNKTIPDLAGTVVSIVVDESYPSDQMMFCVYMKRTSEVPQAALDAIKETFADEKYGVQIGKSIDLWHLPNS